MVISASDSATAQSTDVYHAAHLVYKSAAVSPHISMLVRQAWGHGRQIPAVLALLLWNMHTHMTWTTIERSCMHLSVLL